MANPFRCVTRKAAGILGVSDITFLDVEDGRLRVEPRVSLQLRQLLEQRRPDIVYLPFFLDNHRDHRATSSVLLSATAGTGLDFECRGYEVWTPSFPLRNGTLPVNRGRRPLIGGNDGDACDGALGSGAAGRVQPAELALWRSLSVRVATTSRISTRTPSFSPRFSAPGRFGRRPLDCRPNAQPCRRVCGVVRTRDVGRTRTRVLCPG